MSCRPRNPRLVATSCRPAHAPTATASAVAATVAFLLTEHRCRAVPRPLAGTNWTLALLRDRSIALNSNVNVRFGDDGSQASGPVSGHGGCNSYRGKYDTDMSTLGINIYDLSETEMYCQNPPGVMEQEAEYLDALRNVVSNYRIYGDKLEFVDVNGGLVLSYVPLDGLRVPLPSPNDTPDSPSPVGSATSLPTVEPTRLLTAIPTRSPTDPPFVEETKSPVRAATGLPTVEPTGRPTDEATVEPTGRPTDKATVKLTRFPTAKRNPLSCTAWSLDSLNTEPTIPNANVDIRFDYNGGINSVGGNAGCNQYSGKCVVDASILKMNISGITLTRMYCPEPGVMEQEKEYLEALQQNERGYRIVVGRLELLDYDGKVALSYVPLVDDDLGNFEGCADITETIDDSAAPFFLCSVIFILPPGVVCLFIIFTGNDPSSMKQREVNGT